MRHLRVEDYGERSRGGMPKYVRGKTGRNNPRKKVYRKGLDFLKEGKDGRKVELTRRGGKAGLGSNVWAGRRTKGGKGQCNCFVTITD